MKVGLYSRVSTQEQAKEGYSIGEQIERMTKYADAMNWTVYKKYTDGGFTGSNTDRPALQAMIKDIENGKIEKVVVYKLDRLSRSQLDTLYLIEKVFLVNGCDFVSMSENFDTSTPFGRAMIGILAVFAQLEREQIKERMSVGKEGRAKEGLWHGGQHPVGYDYNPVTDSLTINEFEAMCIREAYELFEKGLSINGISELFFQKGYSHKYGIFSDIKIRRILKNPLYAGYISHNDQLFKGKHSPIISKERYDAMQLLLEEHSKKYATLSKGWKYTTYLGGLIYCGNCGGKYTKQLGVSWKGNPPPLYYTCYSRCKKVKKMIKDPNCKNKNWKMQKLDQIVFDEIKKLSLDQQYIFELKNKNDNVSNYSDKKHLIEKEIEKIDNQISKYMDLYALGTISIDLIEIKINPLTEQRKRLELLYTDVPEEKMSVQEVYEIVSSFEEILEIGNFDEIRMVIEELIEKIVVDNDDVTIYWRFA